MSTPILDHARISARSWADIAVLFALSFIALLGFGSSFGGIGFLIAGVGGLVVGVAVAILAYRVRLGAVLTTLAAIAVYFLVGTPIAVPSQGIAVVLPSLQSLSSLATGAVFGWADALTLKTPIGAPVYIAAVPYVSGWLVGLVFTTLAVRWLSRRTRASWRYALLLTGPVALYVVGVLTGTDQPVLAGIRGITFAVLTLVWLGWRRTANQSASAASNRGLVRRKLVGTLVIVLAAVLVSGGVGILVPQSSYARFVLRDKITPPFDPLDYPSPLAGFRHYTKTAVSTKLFTVTGLKPHDRIRIATLDSYTGQLWNVVGTDVASDGSGSFSLVGPQLRTSALPFPSTPRNLHITVDSYADTWIPLVGQVRELELGGTAAGLGDDLRYNSTTGTAALAGSGVNPGMQFTLETDVPTTPSTQQLDRLQPADVTLPAIANSPDVIAAQAQQHSGNGTPYEKLLALSDYLKKNGHLSHGTIASPSPSGHGENRMIAMFPPNGVLVGDAEQFASAFALEARSLGYPARVVMGFAPTIPAGGGPVTVVGKDVTAWAEVDFAKVGWVAFNPTPTQTSAPPVTPPPPVSQTVTQSRQPNRAIHAQNDILSPVAVNKQKQRKTPFRIPAWAYLVGGIVLALLLLYFVPVLIVGGIKRRRRSRRRKRGSGDARVAGAWDELLDNYAELGFRVPRRTTRILTAKSMRGQAKATEADDGPSLVELAATTDQAVFSGGDIPDDQVAAAWAAAARELSHVRQTLPRWRRWMSRFRIRSKRGMPAALANLDATAATSRVKELISR